MVRVLHVFGGLGFGGAESVIMNWYRNIDRSIIQFDFLVRSSDTNCEEEIKAMGGNVYHVPPFPRSFIRNYIETNRILKKGKWDIIHVHANALIYLAPLWLAKRYGISTRIIHSHNTHSSFTALHNLNKRLIDYWVTDKFACSDLAAKWMFGDKEYVFIPNGIDLQKFSFDDNSRNTIREKYRIESKTVIGHVGRFTYQKNHKFIIDFFCEYHNRNADSVLMFIGNGEMFKQIQELVENKGLHDSVIFCGAVSDIHKYYSAMDRFIFPSHYEGLPIALIEAQANGLPCLISNIISPMAMMNSNVEMRSLNDNRLTWVETLSQQVRIPGNAIDTAVAQYDEKIVAKRLESFYCARQKMNNIGD